jgi:nicotinamidase-related amidase
MAGQGNDPEKWTPLASTTRPAALLGVRDDEYVLSKSGQDAFISSNIAFLLENLEIKNIVFVGGHTNPGGCLGQTARSARNRGYKILCVEDATFDAGESTRKKGIDSVPFDYVVTTEQFLQLTEQAKDA